ncbi:hypothetical protein EPI10_020345 [Gossypium australe]|uniref:Uncharacterized protein n=1 Tax=Gossypium australe TaxID=47621 RepID=A0A5B6WEY8_9ROSI|nr:hypothetical protein EPI10_020345 [Gossypium australe]
MVVMYTPKAVNLLSPAKRRIGENAPNYLCIEWITKITVGYGRLLLFFSETSSAWDTCILLCYLSDSSFAVTELHQTELSRPKCVKGFGLGKHLSLGLEIHSY